MFPLYQHLLKNHFRQIHFHFADGTSFLRMHQPQLFGDQLAGSRPSDTGRPTVLSFLYPPPPAISFGIAHNPGNISLEELILLADAKIYAVKKRRKAAAASKSTESVMAG